MEKKINYKETFGKIEQFFPYIIGEIKKDLKSKHLSADRAFLKRNFTGKVPAKIKEEELVAPYWSEIMEGDQKLGEFLSNQWLLKHTDIYDYYAGHLGTINPNFDEIESIDDPFAEKIVEGAVEQFGALDAYIFAVLNCVVFSREIYDQFVVQARESLQEEKSFQEKKDATGDIEELKKRHERELSRLKDRFEKKLSGMEKKYFKDTDTLKKQIANLQRKLQAQLEEEKVKS